MFKPICLLVVLCLTQCLAQRARLAAPKSETFGPKLIRLPKTPKIANFHQSHHYHFLIQRCPKVSHPACCRDKPCRMGFTLYGSWRTTKCGGDCKKACALHYGQCASRCVFMFSHDSIRSGLRCKCVLSKKAVANARSNCYKACASMRKTCLKTCVQKPCPMRAYSWIAKSFPVRGTCEAWCPKKSDLLQICPVISSGEAATQEVAE